MKIANMSTVMNEGMPIFNAKHSPTQVFTVILVEPWYIHYKSKGLSFEASTSVR